MRKNWTLRIAVLIAVLALATSCFVSGTFAKYVTSGVGEDNARVAKFGVTVTGSSDLFSTTYAKDDTTFTLAANTVVSSNDDKLVAPGTEGSMTDFALTGTPEVAVRVTYKVDEFELGDKWMVDDDDDSTTPDVYYCPLVITVNGTDFSGLDYSDADAFEAAVKTAIENKKTDYAANTDLSGTTADDLTISWAWAFETGADATEKAANDKLDTKLGDQAAAGNAATISLIVSCIVTQID